MSIARALRTATRAELRRRIVTGHPIDPEALSGWVYRGTSLGLPGFIEALSWKIFQKTFYRDPETGVLRGWNVRLEQRGIDEPSVAKQTRGRPRTEWFYEVCAPTGIPTPSGFDRGLIIDYSRGNNPGWSTVNRIKDPLVALSVGSTDELIGVSYLVIGSRCIETPTYFTLERERRIDFVP